MKRKGTVIFPAAVLLAVALVAYLNPGLFTGTMPLPRKMPEKITFSSSQIEPPVSVVVSDRQQIEKMISVLRKGQEFLGHHHGALGQLTLRYSGGREETVFLTPAHGACEVVYRRKCYGLDPKEFLGALKKAGVDADRLLPSGEEHEEQAKGN